MSQVEGFGDKVGFIWSVADLLRGDYKAHEYGQVILPLTVLRRLDCVLEPTKDVVVAKAKGLVGKIDNIDPILLRAAGQPFYNVSPLNFTRLLDDAPNIAANLRTYIAGYTLEAPTTASARRSAAATPSVIRWRAAHLRASAANE